MNASDFRLDIVWNRSEGDSSWSPCIFLHFFPQSSKFYCDSSQRLRDGRSVRTRASEFKLSQGLLPASRNLFQNESRTGSEELPSPPEMLPCLEEPPPSSEGPGLPLLREDDVLDPGLVGGDLRVDPGHVPPPAADAEAHDAHLAWQGGASDKNFVDKKKIIAILI